MTGPFETERQAWETPEVQAAWTAVRAALGPGQMEPHNRELIEDACRAAGVGLGAYDARIVAWLAGWEPQMCAVIAGLVRRAAALPVAAVAVLDAAQLDTVLEALADATNYRAVRAETTCADCHAEPGGLCHDHAGDFEKADGYGALADQLRQEASR